MFLINSTNELVPLDQLTSMQNALTSKGVPVSTLILPGTAHAVDYMGQVAYPIIQYLTANL
jgi:dipeptidyl aminopeptidase/acylaminoacyl peptidase